MVLFRFRYLAFRIAFKYIQQSILEEHAVGGRIAAPDDVDPKRFFDFRLEQLSVDVEIVLLGAFPHAVERAFDHVRDGGNFDARVRAEDRDGLLALLGGNAHHHIKHQRRQHRTVFAAAEAHQPGPGVIQIQRAERVLDFLKSGRGHCGRV